MTVRTFRTTVAQNVVVIHAGPAAELANLAREYAAGKHGPLVAAAPRHFDEVAERLMDGFIAESAGYIQFWRDHPVTGTPFQGPKEYRPDPDPVWVATEAARRATAAAQGQRRTS